MMLETHAKNKFDNQDLLEIVGGERLLKDSIRKKKWEIV